MAALRNRRRPGAGERGPHPRAGPRSGQRRHAGARRPRRLAPSAGRRRPRPARQRRDAGGGGRRRADLGRRRRAAARRAAHARRRLPDRAPTAPTSGVVLSASHNPMPDNGIKLFAAGGLKLPDAVEAEIEARARDRRPVPARSARPSAGCAAPTTRSSATARTCSARSPTRLDGLHVVVDCANGAASAVAPEIYRGAGRPGQRDRRRARRAEHQRRRRAPPTSTSWSTAVRAAAPTSASPTTATPTAAWPSTPTARWSTATSCWPSARSRCARPAACATTPSSPP